MFVCVECVIVVLTLSDTTIMCSCFLHTCRYLYTVREKLNKKVMYGFSIQRSVTEI